MNTLELQKQANEIRKGIIAAVHSAKSGHPGRFSFRSGHLYLSLF